MDRQDILAKVAHIIADHFDIAEQDVTEQLNLKEDLHADSIAIMEVVLEIEEAFDIEISDEAMENIKTIGDAIDYLSTK